MQTHCCRESAGNTRTKSDTATAVLGPSNRRFQDITGWMLPAGGLLLLPKCPACLAAYIFIITGVGISVSAATYLRFVFLTICIASITYFVARREFRLFAMVYGKRRHGKAARSLRPFLSSKNFRE
jgi:hypothetical protein